MIASWGCIFIREEGSRYKSYISKLLHDTGNGLEKLQKYWGAFMRGKVSPFLLSLQTI